MEKENRITLEDESENKSEDINPDSEKVEINVNSDNNLSETKEELKSYQKIGNFYVKWVWNWNTDHTIILLILVELIMAMVRPPK